MWILQILLLILMLGIIILIHECGHFLFAKLFHVHIYQFSIGMGPVIWTHKGKDKVDYNLRAFPIGGFVQMAGEVYEDDQNIDKSKFMCNKPWLQRLLILVAGVTFNFILAIIILFCLALFNGSSVAKPIVSEVLDGYPIKEAGIVVGDKITYINGYKITNWDKAQIVLVMKSKDDIYEFTIEHENGEVEDYNITPKTEKDEDGNEVKKFGVAVEAKENKGLFNAIKYSFEKFGTIISSMALTIWGLLSGKIALGALSGPVGMYEVVGQSLQLGFVNIIYLVAFLSINVGFINILPFPAFDGGHVLFMIIEKIKGSPVNQKIENMVHTIGFILILLLMLYITIMDVIKLF